MITSAMDSKYVGDDPSHHGLSRNLSAADSVVVLDRNGNLLWGNVPQPKFSNNYVVKPGESRITRVGDVVYVDIDVTGYLNFMLSWLRESRGFQGRARKPLLQA